MNNKLIVIDASVALKRQLNDEECTEQTTILFDDFGSGKLGLIVPTIFDYEITNALKVAVDRGRLTTNQALLSFEYFKYLEIDVVNFTDLQLRSFQLAQIYQISIYDSVYLALAENKKVLFYTGDKKLFNSVKDKLDWVKWIGNYNFDDIPYLPLTNNLL